MTRRLARTLPAAAAHTPEQRHNAGSQAGRPLDYPRGSTLRSSAAPVHAHSTNFGLAGAARWSHEFRARLDCERRVRPRDSGESFHRPRGWIATSVFVVALAVSGPNCQHGWEWRPPASWASQAFCPHALASFFTQ